MFPRFSWVDEATMWKRVDAILMFEVIFTRSFWIWRRDQVTTMEGLQSGYYQTLQGSTRRLNIWMFESSTICLREWDTDSFKQDAEVDLQVSENEDADKDIITSYIGPGNKYWRVVKSHTSCRKFQHQSGNFLYSGGIKRLGITVRGKCLDSHQWGQFESSDTLEYSVLCYLGISCVIITTIITAVIPI